MTRKQPTALTSTVLKSHRLRRRILEAEVINPAKLTAMQRNVVARRLYSLHQRIFETLRYKVLHPQRTTLLFATLVHQSSYHMLCRHYWRCYPHSARRTPDRWHRLLLHLFKAAGLEPVDPDEPFVLRVGWITRETDADRAAWRKSPHADVQYFLARKPDYGLGHGLAMIAPSTVADMTMTFFKYAWHLVQLQKSRRSPA